MASLGHTNAKSPTIKRILKEASELASSPSADYHAAPLEANLFEWHFTLRGPPSPSPYANGLYHGRIVLPPTYPLRPPSFRFLTPSGRFEVNREICLSISGHHEETWQPAWGIRTALVALRSFMDGEAKGQLGGVDAGREVRMRLAGQSGAFKCAGCGGRQNSAIMKEQEDAAAALEAEQGAKEKEAEVVPEELMLGYRDELGDKKPVAEAEESLPKATIAPVTSETQPIPPNSPVSPPASQITISNAGTTPARPIVRQAQHQAPNNWIDMAICAIGAALALMVIKKLLSVFA